MRSLSLYDRSVAVSGRLVAFRIAPESETAPGDASLFMDRRLGFPRG